MKNLWMSAVALAVLMSASASGAFACPSQGAQFAGNAEASLAPKLGVLGCVVQREFCVIEIIEFAQARDHRRDEFFIFGATFEMLFHFGDGEGSAHEGALRGHVELDVGGELAGG